MNFPFVGPVHLPPDTLRHVGSFKKKDGTIGAIMRLPAEVDREDNGPLAWEHEQELFDIDVSSIKVQPMPMPSALIFYAEYKYGEKVDV